MTMEQRGIGICREAVPIPGVILHCDRPNTTVGRPHQQHHATYELAASIVQVWWTTKDKPTRRP